MTTKRTKTAPAARKSVKKAAPKTRAPRKRPVKVAAPDQPAVHDDEPVHYVHNGNTYELERVEGGYSFSGQPFKSLAGFGKYLTSLDEVTAAEPTATAEPETAPPPATKRSRKQPAAKRETPPRDPRLAPGATLTRMYKGNEITVKVQDDGTFLYEGQIFRSISAVAKHITGYSISGPVFFHLVEPKAAEAK